MDDIPDDIRAKAFKVANAIGAGLAIGSTDIIARALLAQDRAATERAAKIAENYQTDWAPDADNIADAIRQP